MSTALTNSPAEMMVNLVNNSSPSSDSSFGGDDILNNLNQHNNLINETNIMSSNSTNQNNTNSENELNHLLINNQSPLCLNNSSSPLSNNSLIVNTTNNLKEELSNKDNLNKQQFNEICNQNNNSNNLNNLIPINITSNNQTSSPKSTINSNLKMNVKLDTSENLSPLNTSSNSSSSNITLAQQSSSTVPLSSSVQSHVQWTGTNSSNNYSLNGNNVSTRYQPSVNNNSYHSNFGSLTNNHGSSSNSFQPSNTSNNSNNSSNPTNSPYIEYNGYSGQILSQPSTPPSTVPNMFTAAAVAAASSGALNNSQSGTPKSSSINSSEFSFNGNNSNSSNSSLSSTKKYLATPPSSVGSVVLESQQPNVVHSDSIDQTLFYGSTNNSTLSNNGSNMNKNNALSQQSPPKPQQAQLTEFSAPLVNNYANFAPNSNSYWQPGSTTSQMNMSNGNNVYQQQHNKQAIMQPSSANSLIHHNIPSTGHQLDEASQASTPNSQLDELRSETPNKNGSQTPITNSNYLNTVSMNNVSNNSSSNSSTSSTNSSNGPNNSNNVNNLNNGKGMPVYSFPPTPNTIGSPGASVMSAGFYDEYESVPNTTWSKNHRLDGLMKLYEISNEPGRKIFLDKLISFNEERGTTISSCPTINKNLIDLYRLYSCVKERGGFLQTTKAKQWKECATICNITISTTTAYILRKQYVKHLLGFECKYDLNGADPAQIVAQTENANRKKRKSKSGSDQTSPIQGSNMINTNNQLGSSKDINSMQPNQISGQAHHLHPSHIAQNQHQTGIHHHPQQQTLINGSMSQHSTLNNRQQQPPSQQSSISMQQPYSSSILNMGNSNNSSSTMISNGPNSFSTNLNGYSNYNNNVAMSNYVPSNNNSSIYGSNNMYNNSSIDYNNSKMSVHQLPVQQQTNFFPNGPMVNNSANGSLTTNQSNSLVSNSIQPASQHLHNANLQSQPIPHQQSNLNQHQSYFQNNNNSNIMYNNNGLINSTINNTVPSQSEFYGSYSTSNNSGPVHPQNTNSMYNVNNSNSNNLQQPVYNEEMMKFNSSRQQPINDINNSNTNANLPQSSLPPQQQLNSSNNSDNQYLNYNGHPDSNYSNNIYSAPNRQQALSNNGYSTINSYNNGPTMLESNNFEKNNSSKNLMDFHSLKSGPITSANNGGIALDTYMSDPYVYEPENKRFHAMSNC